MTSTEAQDRLARTSVVPQTVHRFVPNRAGIINVWDYVDEEFSFAGGWLVLRGPNGSGKTKALEVLFPLLLDGRIEPRRLNPFASEERTMKSNLLYRGQQAGYGYVWMEFTLRDEAGALLQAVTVGIGLRAQKHDDKVVRWYFVVDGRVGVDFSLIGRDDRPLTRSQLEKQLGPGSIKDTPKEHRQAVDKRLFGLGSQRYDQMIALMLTLRRPQLTANLDPAGLSNLLTAGLRPLDDELLDDAAQSFDDLESVQSVLDGLAVVDEATRELVAVYQTYLRTHARAAVNAVRDRSIQVVQNTAALTVERIELASAEQKVLAAEAELTEAQEAQVAAEAELGQHKDSSAYRDHLQLLDLQSAVDQSVTSATETGSAEARQRGQVVRLAQQFDEVQESLGNVTSAEARLGAELKTAAAFAGIDWDVEPAAGEFVDHALAKVAAREHDIRAVRGAVHQQSAAELRRAEAQSALARVEQAEHVAASVLHQAEEDVATQQELLRQRLSSWFERHSGTFAELDVPHVLPALAAVAEAVGDADAPQLRDILERAVAPARQTVVDDLALLGVERDNWSERRRGVEAERELIAGEQQDAPAPARTRTADRTDRAGAPLWRLVRFADDVAPLEAAAIEGALDAAGLLDAWVSPDDEATSHAVEQVLDDGFLCPLPAGARPSGRTLAAVLIAEEAQADVPVDRLNALLASIGLADDLAGCTDAVVLTDRGQFTQGVQVGGLRKEAVEYVGAAARARRRTVRLAECDRRAAEITGRLRETEQLITRARTVLDATELAIGELPRTSHLVAALRVVAEKAGALASCRAAADSARTVADAVTAEANSAARIVMRTAAETRLGTEERDLDATAGAVREFSEITRRIESVRAKRADVQSDVGRTRSWLDEAVDALEAASEAAQTARLRMIAKQRQLEVLRANAGLDAEEILAKVEQARSALEALKRRVAQAHELDKTAESARVAAVERLRAAQVSLTQAIAEEQVEARHRLRVFARADVLELLGITETAAWPGTEGEWLATDSSPTLPPTVAALLDELENATKNLAATEASLKQSTTRLRNGIEDYATKLIESRQDFRAEWDNVDGVIVVQIADETGLRSLQSFADRMRALHADQEVLLTDREKHLFEDALLTRLARQVHDRVVDARDFIKQMNEDMRKRTMSSGMAIGVSWTLSPALDDGEREANKIIKDAQVLTPSQLATLRRHFASKVKAAHAQAPHKTYRELLSEQLDYRRWHRFVFVLVPPDGEEEQLTRARHSKLSGGEQSVSLHLPLFAAAHATLCFARPTAPRLVALDEAFAGVDDTGRNELMTLASKFRLDLLMTGYDLWVTHPTVPMTAHYDLSHSAVDHVVSALLLVWDGEMLLPDRFTDGGLARSLGSPGTRRAAAAVVGGLLDEERE